MAEGNIPKGGTSQLQTSPYLVGPHLQLETDESPAERRIVKMAGHMFTVEAERDKARE